MVFKYVRIGINSFKSQNIFSMDSIISSVIDILSVFVLAFVWKYLGFKKSIDYFFVIFLSNLFIPDTNLLKEIDEEVRTGRLILGILRPIRYDLKIYFSFLFRRTSSFSEIVIFLVLWSLFGVNLLKLLFILPILFLSSFLTFYIYFTFFSISMRTESSWGFAWTFELFFKRLLSGQLIPTKFLREYIGKLYDLLPFRYMVGFVSESYLGELNLLGVLIQMFWVFIFFVFSNTLFRREIRNYEGYGI